MTLFGRNDKEDSDTTFEQEQHNAGQEDGARGDLFSDIIEKATPVGWVRDAFLTEEFKEGRENGRNNRPK